MSSPDVAGPGPSRRRAEERRAPPPPLPAWWIVVGVLVLTAFYVLTGAENHSEAEDAFWYAHDVEVAPWADLLDPFHLVYLPVMRVAWMGARGLGLVERAFPVMVFLGAVCAAVAVVGFGVLLHRRLRLSTGTSIAGMAALATAYGFWRFAAEAEVYALGIMSVVLFFVLVLGDSRRHPLRWFMTSVLVGALAVGSHILAVIPVLLAAPLHLALEGRARHAAAVTGATVVLLLAGSALVYPIAAHPDQTYFEYVTRDIDDEPGRSFSDLSEVAKVPVGLGQALFASSIVMAGDRLYETVNALFPEKMLEDEKFTASRTPRLVRLAGFATFVLAVGLLIVLAVATLTRLTPRMLQPDVGPYVLWFAGHAAAVLVVGSASNLEAWPLALPPVVILVAVAADGNVRQAPRREWIFLLAILLAVHNGLVGMLPLADSSRDRNAVKGEWLVDNAASDDVVLTADGPGFARYLTYWSHARVVDLQTMDAAAVDSAYRAELDSGAGTLYVTADLFEPPDYFRYLHPDRAAALAVLAGRIEPAAEPVATDRSGATFMIPRARTSPE